MMVAVVSCSSLAATPDAGTPGPAATDAITLERTGCFGSCPAYRLTVFGDGKVEYQGRDCVKVSGERRWTLEPAKVTRLFSELERIGFFALGDQAPIVHVTDAERVKTTAVVGRRKNEVERTPLAEQFSGGSSAPQKALAGFEALIDELTGSREVVGSPDPTTCRHAKPR